MLREVEAGWPSAVSADLNAEQVTLSDDEIRERMSGNLCRCAAYANIVPAIAERNTLPSDDAKRNALPSDDAQRSRESGVSDGLSRGRASGVSDGLSRRSESFVGDRNKEAKR
jgi:hypothetical protein